MMMIMLTLMRRRKMIIMIYDGDDENFDDMLLVAMNMTLMIMKKMKAIMKTVNAFPHLCNVESAALSGLSFER